jgi:hypothetical protein
MPKIQANGVPESRRGEKKHLKKLSMLFQI